MVRDDTAATDDAARRFGLWLEGMLRVRGWSRAELGRRIGSHGSLVSKWVHGYQRPDSLSCREIAAAFNIDADEVLVLAGHVDPNPKPINDPVWARLHHLIDQLPSPILAPFIGVFEGLLDRHPEEAHIDHDRTA